MLEYKLYDINGVYKRTLNPTMVFPIFSVEQSIDSGVNQFSFEVNKDYDEVLDQTEQMIVIKEYNDKQKNGRLLFKGFLEDIEGEIDNTRNTIKYTFGGIHKIMSQKLYHRPGYKSNLQAFVNNIINTELGTRGTLFSNAIPSEEDIKSKEFTGHCLGAMIDAFKMGASHFFVKPSGEIIGGKKTTNTDHVFTLGVNAGNLKVKRPDLRDIVNRVKIKGVRYEDADSVAIYGPREKEESVNDDDDLDTRVKFANQYLKDHARGQREIELEVILDDYSLIYPTQNVTLLNTRLDNVKNLQIVKTSYDGEKMTIYLEKLASLPEMILSLLNK